jgi:serine/threonine-protein kinase
VPAPPARSRPAPRAEAGRIQPGDILNHIFEVKRFLARGGMGEVFEGVNVTSDERVAIKVMLPALAADPNVQAMFRKEGADADPALARSTGPVSRARAGAAARRALHRHRVHRRGEPVRRAGRSGRGRGGADPAAAQARLRACRWRIRSGAIHRDISPDNVLLEHGELAKARIIDFGIAKDLDPGSKTIIGDGFAGKLSYVAPEQLGDFDREIGPWTDVYSLGLVILAVANKGGIDLGGSFVDAIDKRRKGIPLDAAPPGLRRVLEAMLRANPGERLRSMDAVITALDTAPPPVAGTNAAPGKPAKAAKVSKPKPPRDDAAGKGLPKPALAAGGAVALLALAGGGWLLTRGGGEAERTTAASAEAPVEAGTAAPVAPSADRARAALASALPQIPCSWLDLAGVDGAGEAMTVKLTGVAGRPAEAQAAIARIAGSNGASLAGHRLLRRGTHQRVRMRVGRCVPEHQGDGARRISACRSAASKWRSSAPTAIMRARSGRAPSSISTLTASATSRSMALSRVEKSLRWSPTARLSTACRSRACRSPISAAANTVSRSTPTIAAGRASCC